MSTENRNRTQISPTARAMLLIAGEVVLLALILFAIFSVSPVMVGENAIRQEVQEEVDVDEAVRETVDPHDRGRLSVHTIERGDTLWDLAEAYWNNRHLWPDLYVHNMGGLDDPDDLTVGEQLDIPEPLMRGGHIGEQAVEYLLDGYIDAYEAYRRRADLLERRFETERRPELLRRSRLKLARAQWLLYSGTRFDRDYLNRYMAEIHAEDRDVVDFYLRRFGTPEMRNSGL